LRFTALDPREAGATLESTHESRGSDRWPGSPGGYPGPPQLPPAGGSMSHPYPSDVFVAHTDPIIAAGIRAVLHDDVRFRVCDAAAGGAGFDEPGGVANPGPRMLIVSQLDSEVDIRAAVAAGVEGYVLQGCSAQELRDAAATV